MIGRRYPPELGDGQPDLPDDGGLGSAPDERKRRPRSALGGRIPSVAALAGEAGWRLGNQDVDERAPTSIAISRDGRNVYVASDFGDAAAVFARDRRTGALKQLTGIDACVSEDGSGACGDAAAVFARDRDRNFLAVAR